MIVSSYERIYYDAWRGYVGADVATKLLARLREEIGVDDGFGIVRPKYVDGVMQAPKAPAWADELSRGIVPMVANSKWQRRASRPAKRRVVVKRGEEVA